MCTRSEVQEIVDRSYQKLHDDFKGQLEAISDQLKEFKLEREKRMEEIADRKITQAKDNFIRYIGWGGIVGVGMFVYFFGGLTRDVDTMQTQMVQVQESLDEVETFISRGDRFTVDDGKTLQTYSDQQDAMLQRQINDVQTTMKSGFEDLKLEIRNMHSNN